MFYGTFNAGTSTVKFSDADHTVNASFTLYNWQWATPLTAPRTLTINAGETVTKAAGGTFNLNGSSAVNTVSFAGTGTISPAITVYYCGSSTVTGIDCQPGGPPAPEINLKQGATNIASAGSHDFGSVAVGSNSGAITFTIENTGSVNLTLSGSPKIVKSGADMADFTVDETSTASPVAGSTSTTFTVTFTPSSAAAKTASLSIANNDSDENPYTVTLNGTGTPAAAPEINLKQGATNIASAGSHDFGTVAVGSSSGAITFTIENTGSANLTLGGTPKIVKSGADAADFTVDETSTSSPVAGAASTTFTVTFTPSSAAAKTASLSIANNDSDENPYTVTLNGTGTPAAAPEINLKQGATNIASAGSHDFGTVAVGSNSGAITFTVENTGSANLTLGGTPKIVKSGADAADFTVDETSTSSPVAGAASTTFTVTFTPSSAAAKTASLSIANNDSDENPYTVTLNGTGTVAPTPGYGSNPAPGSTVNVGTATVGSPVSTTLAVSETGNAALNVTSHALGGTNPGDFSVTPATLTIADSGAAQNLTIQCTPSAAGARTATLTVNHNAAGSPATYTLNCTGTSAPVTAGVSMVSVSNVKATTALATGTASGTGIGERGFFWWNDETYWGPNASGLIPAGYGAGDFSLTLSNLPIQTQLYVSAYAKIGGQLVTSDNRISITTTDPMLPTVITKPDFTVNGNEVLAKGEITDVGSSSVTIYGFVYAKHTSPTVWDMALPFTWDMTLPISVGKAFEGTIKNLADGKYYFRSYAHNAQGTAYGEEFSFTITGSSDCGGGVPGDLNGDGNIDLTDVIIALKILDGVPVADVNLKADVNGDCRIGMEEAIFVLQKVGMLR